MYYQDDFFVVGEEEHQLELKAALEKVYKLKERVLCPYEGDSKEGVYLGRRIHWWDWGIDMEGNPKHIQELLKTMEMESCKVAEAKFFRRGTALCVCISQARGHISASWRQGCSLARVIGVSNVLKEMRDECWGDLLEHAVVAPTCKSILLRRGPGGIKHLDTKQLWVPEAFTEKSIRV